MTGHLASTASAPSRPEEGGGAWRGRGEEGRKEDWRLIWKTASFVERAWSSMITWRGEVGQAAGVARYLHYLRHYRQARLRAGYHPLDKWPGPGGLLPRNHLATLDLAVPSIHTLEQLVIQYKGTCHPRPTDQS